MKGQRTEDPIGGLQIIESRSKVVPSIKMTTNKHTQAHTHILTKNNVRYPGTQNQRRIIRRIKTILIKIRFLLRPKQDPTFPPVFRLRPFRQRVHGIGPDTVVCVIVVDFIGVEFETLFGGTVVGCVAERATCRTWALCICVCMYECTRVCMMEG